MKQETIENVEAAIADWELLTELPAEVAGFHFSVRKVIAGESKDMYDIFAYDNPPAHACVTAYYHEETQEYKLRVRVGFIEFCRIEFITADLDVFTGHLKAHLTDLLDGLTHFNPASLSVLVREKGILAWPYAEKLPETLEGYTLFIRPTAPVKITNGSCIVIDYVDFAHDCSVTIYYNLFRDAFFGEARVHSIPDVTYDFDCKTLQELQEHIEQHLVPRLKWARKTADASKKETPA